jgi:RNA methyltransferase, TrmH family
VERISSRQNPLVKRFRDVARSVRRDNQILLDGAHLVTEALDANVPLEVIAVVTGKITDEADAIMRRASSTGTRAVSVSAPVLAAISPVRQPSGIVAIARAGMTTIERVLARTPQLVVIIAGAQDPGNVGAIVRAAEACGATGVITTPGTADPFAWKALRGSMGSAFRLPIAAQPSARDAMRIASNAGLRTFASVPRDGTPLPSADLSGPAAILVGGEGAGLDPDVVANADERIAIPMSPHVDSLNVATAAALIVYEAARQRDAAAPRRLKMRS